MMLAKIAGGVKELFRNDWGFEFYLIERVVDGFALRRFRVSIQLRCEIKGFTRRLQAGIAALEECPHIGRNESIRQPIEGCFRFNLAKVKSAGGVQIHNTVRSINCADAGPPYRILKRDEPHNSSRSVLISRSLVTFEDSVRRSR